jgi:uncharacterized pyridoxamine 5'-phosphate oxidase family protein
LRPFIIAEDRRFVEVIEIADEKLHVVSANKEYFDKTVEGFKNITFVTCTTDGGSSQPININVHWIDEMTFEMKRKLIQVIPEVHRCQNLFWRPTSISVLPFVVNFKYILEDMDEDVGYI